MHNLCEHLMETLNHILKYYKGYLGRGLHSIDNVIELDCRTNGDWVVFLDDRWSTSYCTLIGGSLISPKRSWICSFSFHVKVEYLFCDNKKTIKSTNNLV